MAFLQLPAPGNFSIRDDPHSTSKRWQEWSSNLLRYLAATGITNETQKRQILLYTAGKEVSDLYSEIITTETDTTEGEPTVEPTVDQLIALFTKHFQGRDNIVFLRYQFRQCVQDEGESIDAWHSRLWSASEACQFESLRYSLVRDQIVASCRSESLRKRLLNIPNINLADTLQLARTHEAAEKQAAIMSRTAAASEEVAQVRRQRYPPPELSRQPQPSAKCIRCGESGHRSCNRAQGKRCTNCGKFNHLAKACLSRSKINALQPEQDQLADQPVNEVFCTLSGKDNSAKFPISINGQQVCTLIDSGASCNVLDMATFRRICRRGTPLAPSSTRVFALGASEPLEAAGQTTLTVRANHRELQANFIVIRSSCTPILGRASSTKLGMLRVGPEACTNSAVVASLANPARCEDQHLPKQLQLESILADFSDRFQGIGCVKGVTITIKLRSDASPVCQPPSRVSVHLRAAVIKELEEQLALGIIERVHGPTPLCSRMVAVPKAEQGEVRITQDLREVNKYVIPEKQPIPTFEEVTDEMAGSTYFSELDVAKAFHQIEVAEESRDLLTFSTPIGLLRLRRLCMGYTSASEILQRVMSSVLSGLPGVRWVHDDILVYAKNIEEHNQRLRDCLARLKASNITLNPKKCRFAQREVDFLAMRLSAVGIHPSTEKVAAINSFKRPTNATEVRSFLGLVTFVARFISNLSDRARPLRELTRQAAEWTWGEQQEAAFKDIKQTIASSEALAFFNSKLPTQLIVDASPTGVGAILAQVQPDGSTRPVAYASRSLSPTEQRYSQTEREALAVKYGGLKFHHYLSGGGNFKVITDHKPLVSLFSPGSRPPPRIERMALRLQDLVFQVVYQPGAGNPSDVLSRQPLPMPPNNVGEQADAIYVATAVRAATPVSISLTIIKAASDQDSTVQAALHAIRGNQWDKSDTRLQGLHGVAHELSELDGLLLCRSQLYMPTALRYRCLQLAHQGHQGVRKTLDRLQPKVWWPGMRASVEAHVAACISCQACTRETAPKSTPLKPTELPEGPWLELGLDFLGPVSGKSLLVCTDHFSRFPLVEVMPSTTASAVTKVLRRWFSIFGQPTKVTTDNGPPFASAEFSSFLADQGARHHRITPLYPQANGATERCNQGLNKAIRAAVLEGRDWTLALDEYLAAYRRTPHCATGVAPASLLFGRQINDVIPSLQHSQPIDVTRAAIADRDRQAKEEMKRLADQRSRAADHAIRPGDRVLRRLQSRQKTDAFYEPV
ncbi:hypothetical protein BOX15_Mlig022181g5, partial [Macrostomum lignano]